MSDYMCPQCGHPLNGNEPSCPACGGSFSYAEEQPRNYNPGSPTAALPQTPQNPITLFAYRERTDWANYIYECWIIGWNAWKRSFQFTGRASRREFWSYFLIFDILLIIPIIGWLLGIIGFLAVQIRRLHDINKCGWWCLIPFFILFWNLKKSDDGPNSYGEPVPAKTLVD